MGLLVMFDDNGEAFGDLYWDDGESQGRPKVTGTFLYRHLTITILVAYYKNLNSNIS